MMEWIASAAFGLEGVAANELKRMGLSAKGEQGCARFTGSLEDAYRANLLLRTADRVLLCLAERNGDDFALSVRPTPLPASHPLARMSGDEMGVVYHSDITGMQTATTLETDPIPTAAAMLRDVLDIAAR